MKSRDQKSVMHYWDAIGGKEGILNKIPCGGGGGERRDILNPFPPPAQSNYFWPSLT